ncbi:MAG: amidohydrolase [Candidatus Anaerobiospirillum merdipullorum]|uniref:Amidohydrolase n=1 Tax=Candidatus Anaerobiospirillum merdipullorum TaxID=2838450 RepID=A0A9E2KNW8_9GAMM|nr:amidohydrolase [Candidatus Anaerobiospirillum merdipullorum]
MQKVVNHMYKLALCVSVALTLSACAQSPNATATLSSQVQSTQTTAQANYQAPAWLEASVAEVYPEAVKIRHYLHQHPELGCQEVKTQAYIADFLQQQGIEVIKGTEHAPTAVIGVLNPGKGHAIGIRADIDALPIKENTGLPYASTVKGMFFGREADVSHMCGHDAHMAMLLAAAKVMAAHKDDIARTVVFLFQPAEEGDSRVNPYDLPAGQLAGANAMVQDGVLERFGIEKVFGIHVMARQPAGKMLIAKGPALNSVDDFRVQIQGEQAHGAMPWTGVDATLTAAAAVVNLQQIVSRNIPLNSGMGVITVGRLQAGETSNVMAGSAEFEGTIRSNNAQIRSMLLQRIPEVIAGTAAAYGAKAQTRILEIYPVTVNDPDLATATVAQLQDFGVDAQLSQWNPGASEDFSFFAQKVPGVFMFLGVDKPGSSNAANNHSDKFVIDDTALKAGITAHVAVALSPL